MKLKHTNIAQLKCAWADSKFYYLLIDYAINGDLLNFLKAKGKENHSV